MFLNFCFFFPFAFCLDWQLALAVFPRDFLMPTTRTRRAVETMAQKRDETLCFLLISQTSVQQRQRTATAQTCVSKKLAHVGHYSWGIIMEADVKTNLTLFFFFFFSNVTLVCCAMTDPWLAP
jgi:hypothetical protein